MQQKALRYTCHNVIRAATKSLGDTPGGLPAFAHDATKGVGWWNESRGPWRAAPPSMVWPGLARVRLRATEP